MARYRRPPILVGALLVALTTSCGNAVPPPTPLTALLAEKKFQPDKYYTGVDTPEDQVPLASAVDNAIQDIAAMPEPRDADRIRRRLKKLISDVDLFATEDRDMAYRYAIKIWRASGQSGESKLFAAKDYRILNMGRDF